MDSKFQPLLILILANVIHECLAMNIPDESTKDLETTSDPLELYSGSTIMKDMSTAITDIAITDTILSTDLLLHSIEIIDNSPGRKQPKTSPGWSWQPMAWPWWIVLQLISAILGIVGNLLVILVVFRKNSTSRSTDILVGNLAVADFLVSIVMIPLPIARRMPLSIAGRLYCIFFYSPTLKWMLTTVSSYHLVAISFDRYFAVVHPLVFNRMVTKRRVYVCVALVWLTILASSSRGIFIRYIKEGNGRCIIRKNSQESKIAYASYNLCLRLVIPTFLILLTQLLIVKGLYREAQRFSETLNEGVAVKRSSVHLAARARVLKLMLIVTIVFFICWAPSQIAFFGMSVGFLSSDYSGSVFQRSFLTMAFFNSCVNPIIYTVRNPQFRAALKNIFICSKTRHGPIFEHKVDTKSSTTNGGQAMTSILDI